MKEVLKLFLLLWLFLATISSRTCAQGRKHVQVGVGGGFAPTWSFGEPSSSSNLAIFFIEPRYVRGDNTFALRGEAAFLHAASIGVAFHHGFRKDKMLRPFIGLGCGYFYRSLYYDANPRAYQPSEARNIGFFPRVGVRWRERWEIIADYNLVPSTNTTLTISPNQVLNVTANNNYLAIKFCLVINSGR